MQVDHYTDKTEERIIIAQAPTPDVIANLRAEFSWRIQERKILYQCHPYAQIWSQVCTQNVNAKSNVAVRVDTRITNTFSLHLQEVI